MAGLIYIDDENSIRMNLPKDYVEPLISAKLPIENWEKAFDMAIHREGFKILLIPAESLVTN